MAYLILDCKDVPVSDQVRVVFDWGGFCYIEVSDNQLWKELYFANDRPGSFADGDLRFSAEWNFSRYPLPDDLEVCGVLDISATSLSELPRRLKCRELKLNGLILSVPRDAVVNGTIVRPIVEVPTHKPRKPFK